MKYLLLAAFLASSTAAQAQISFEQEEAVKDTLNTLHEACLTHAELFSRIMYGHLSGTLSKDKANQIVAPHYAKSSVEQKAMIKEAMDKAYATPRDAPRKIYILVGGFQISEYKVCINLGTKVMWNKLSAL